MAWKLKKSKTTVDEMPQADDESPNAPVSASQFDRPGKAGTQDSDYSDFDGSERTVMLLTDSDYIPGLIPSTPPRHDSASAVRDDADLFPVTSDEDLDRYLRGEQTFDSATLADNHVGGVDIDIDAGHVAGAQAADSDEPAHSGALIDLDDASAGHSAPPELDNIHIPSGNPFLDIDDDPATTAHSGSIHPSAAIDLDDLPTGSARVDTADAQSPSTAPIDLDDVPVSSGPIELDNIHVPVTNPFVDDSPVAETHVDQGASGAGIDLDDVPGQAAHIDIDEAEEAVPVAPPMNGVQGGHAAATADDGDSHYFDSALSASDEAVASLRSAANDEPSVTVGEDSSSPSGHPAGAAAMENWDLDAFAPYQPPAGAAVTVAGAQPTASSGAVPAEETLADAAAVSRLVVRLGQFSASYELTKGETTIGRPDPRTSVFPDVAVEWDDAVSRNHCRVLHKADGDYVEDTGSTNGTRLNDKPIAPYQPILLADGDRIGVGEKTDISYLK